MIFTTSYMDESISTLITSFVRALNPQVVIEIGTQQGYSASLIVKGMTIGSKFITYDLFQDKYENPPYSNTHSNKDIAIENIKSFNPVCQWDVCNGSYTDALKLFPEGIDLLHIDICNHYDNLLPILDLFKDLIYKGMILEGGIENHWQKQYGYKCWNLIMSESWFVNRFQYITIPFKKSNSITLVVKK